MYPQLPVDFGFTEEHELLRQSVRRFLEERCPFSEVRRLAADPLGYDPGLWKEMAMLGWIGLTLSEGSGGAGLGQLHLALVLDEMGRRLLPGPFLASVLAGFALEAAGSDAQRRRFCAPIAAGELLATLALGEPAASWEPEHVAATAEPVEGGWVLRGLKTGVLSAASAGLVIAPFVTPDGTPALFAVELPATGVAVEPEIGIDPTRRTARVAFDGARVGREACLEGPGLEGLRTSYRRGYVALAAEMVGGTEAVLELTRRYAIERKQFERQIGSFQAVKHPIVDTMVGLELARTHALAAAVALDQGAAEAEVAARMAKAIASDVFPTAVRRGVQLHGGYGFTWDCDVHFYFKRALWSRATLGDGAHHRRHLASRLLDDPTPA